MVPEYGGGRGRAVAESLRRRWAAGRLATAAWALVLAACACLFLNAAATIEIVYTLRVSYVLLAAACLVGLPFILEGWRALPVACRWTAGLVVASVLLAAVAGSGESLAVQKRAGAQRELIYLLDLLLGLAVVGLVSSLFRDARSIRLALAAVLVGALVAAAYGIVQWPARHYDWPLANVNNALNPNAISRGEVAQGSGLLLGWERVRGTFTEPLFFGIYLATVLPLVAAWFACTRRRILTCAAVAGPIAVALFLTSSFPSWALFAVAGLGALIVFFVSRGAVLPAAVAGGSVALGAVAIALVVFGSPQIFASVTGREAQERAFTTSTRTGAWEQSVREWSERPLLGHGPGQSAVQLAYRQRAGLAEGSSAPIVLGSAQGLLTAALVDAGLVGALAWLAFLVACVMSLVRGLSRSPSGLRLAVVAASLVAVAGALVSGDRFEIQTWLILGLALTATGAHDRTRPTSSVPSLGTPPTPGKASREVTAS